MPAPENLNTQTPGAQAPSATEAEQQAAPQYKAVHKGGGQHVVIGPNGEPAGDFKGTKDEALAEAARLNAGGLPLVAPTKENAPAAAPVEGAQAPSTVDPKTITRPVLTADGWVCPEK